MYGRRGMGRVGMGETPPPDGWCYFMPTPTVGDVDFVDVYSNTLDAWVQMMAKCAGIGWIYFQGDQAWSNNLQAWLPTYSVCNQISPNPGPNN